MSKLSYIIVTQVQLSSLLSVLSYRGTSVLQRCQGSAISVLLPNVPGSCLNEKVLEIWIVLYSYWMLRSATPTEAREILNFICLFLGINQWFLLVLFRERHHWWIWTAQFFQSSSGHKADFQFSYRIHPGMYTECMFKYKENIFNIPMLYIPYRICGSLDGLCI